MKLIVDAEYRGHHSEYLNNLIDFTKIDKYIFILSNTFIEQNHEKLKRKKVKYFGLDSQHSLKDKIQQIKFINQIVSRYNINECFLLDLNYYLYPLIISTINVNQISSIYYLPHFFDNDSSHYKKQIKNLIFQIISRKSPHKIFILNDLLSVKKLNNIYKKIEFKYLPDPVVTNKYKFSHKNKSKFNFLFIGEISPRKGALVLLDVLESLKNKSNLKYDFTIVGNVGNYKIIQRKLLEIKKCNPLLINTLKLSRIPDLEFERFIYDCDIVLCLHQKTHGSSGILGKAISHKKPVISPNEGLISSLVDTNKMGLVTNVKCPKKVVETIELMVDLKYKLDQNLINKYLDNHKVSNFCKTLLDD